MVGSRGVDSKGVVHQSSDWGSHQGIRFKVNQLRTRPGTCFSKKIEECSCKLTAKAVAGISVLTLKWLSCQGVPLVGAY